MKIFIASPHLFRNLIHNFPSRDITTILNPEKLRGLNKDILLVVFCNHCIRMDYKYKEILDNCDNNGIKYIVV